MRWADLTPAFEKAAQTRFAESMHRVVQGVGVTFTCGVGALGVNMGVLVKQKERDRQRIETWVRRKIAAGY